MKTTAKVFAAWVNGTWTEVKAFSKANAYTRLNQLDSNVKMSDVKKTDSKNSHQAPVEELYPELFA